MYMNQNIEHNFFVWEEKNSTDHNQNSLKNAEQDKCVTTTETKTNVENLHWKDITDPKLRRKMYHKEWRKINKKRLKEYDTTYYKDNEDKIKIYKQDWAKDNKERLQSKQKSYYESNKETLKEYRTNWRKSNNERIKEQGKVYRKLNKTKITKDKQVYSKIKYKTDIQYRLKSSLRSRLRMAIKGDLKSGSAVRDLGCSISEFKLYIESKFQPGMSWDNWGQYGWHIDHIKPIASFNLTDRQQFLEVCHYTNLQPLWWQDNLVKSDKII